MGSCEKGLKLTHRNEKGKDPASPKCFEKKERPGGSSPGAEIHHLMNGPKRPRTLEEITAQ